MKSYRLTTAIKNGATYFILILFAFVMLFPFIFMMATSFKSPKDTFRYPPRLLPREPITIEPSAVGLEGEEPLPLFNIDVEGETREMALVESSIRVGVFAPVDAPEETIQRRPTEVDPVGGFVEQEMVTIDGEEFPLYEVEVNGEIVQMAQIGQTAFGRFIDVENPEIEVLRNERLSEPVERFTWHPENYRDVIELQNMDRSLSNTVMVTMAVVLGTLTTSVLGGYAFARMRFPGRDVLFVMYLGTIMIPFVVLVTPMYQLMVSIGWVDSMVALIVPWIFSAYGTFLMRQFFISIPREIEEAALIDGASRLQILWRIFIPASTPALATLTTFTFLYAWNSFFWPLVVINTGNTDNHVLTLSLNVLRGRASDSPNLILAGAAIAILPPLVIYILGQRFFVESATSSGVKG